MGIGIENLVKSAPDILSKGIIGAGFLLAVLTFWLLLSEQKAKEPRQKIITSIYVFELFCLMLIAGGLWSEITKNEFHAENERLAAENKSVQAAAANERSLNSEISAWASEDNVKHLAEIKILNDELAAAEQKHLGEIEAIRKRAVQQYWIKIIGVEGIPGFRYRLAVEVNGIRYLFPNKPLYAIAGTPVDPVSYPIDANAQSLALRFEILIRLPDNVPVGGEDHEVSNWGDQATYPNSEEERSSIVHLRGFGGGLSGGPAGQLAATIRYEVLRR